MSLCYFLCYQGQSGPTELLQDLQFQLTSHKQTEMMIHCSVQPQSIITCLRIRNSGLAALFLLIQCAKLFKEPDPFVQL